MSSGAPIFRLSPPEKGLTDDAGADGGGTQARLDTDLSEYNPVRHNRKPFCTSTGFREELVENHAVHLVLESPQELAQRLGLKFKDLLLLSRALTHRSYLNEHPEALEDNERLEFLGDAVLDFVVGAWLYNQFPEMPEGDLTRLRSALVYTDQLASFARDIRLGNAMRLGRVMAQLMPEDAEVHGLVALMELQASRLGARSGPGGEPVLLLDQNRGRWDRLLVQRGQAALARAEELGGALGPYALQAAIAACHARARTAGETDWVRIAALYDALAQLAPSPVVELNRAVAVSMAFGPDAALEIVDRLTQEPALKDYHLLPSVRGDLLLKLGRRAEARTEMERAASMTQNERERTLLLRRAAAAAE